MNSLRAPRHGRLYRRMAADAAALGRTHWARRQQPLR